MLILTRKVEEKIIIKTKEGDIIIEVKDIHGSRISIGIEAPEDVKIIREELIREELKDEYTR